VRRYVKVSADAGVAEIVLNGSLIEAAAHPMATPRRDPRDSGRSDHEVERCMLQALLILRDQLHYLSTLLSKLKPLFLLPRFSARNHNIVNCSQVLLPISTCAATTRPSVIDGRRSGQGSQVRRPRCATRCPASVPRCYGCRRRGTRFARASQAGPYNRSLVPSLCRVPPVVSRSTWNQRRLVLLTKSQMTFCQITKLQLIRNCLPIDL
jgi:hypothetical protein